MKVARTVIDTRISTSIATRDSYLSATVSYFPRTRAHPPRMRTRTRSYETRTRTRKWFPALDTIRYEHGFLPSFLFGRSVTPLPSFHPWISMPAACGPASFTVFQPTKCMPWGQHWVCMQAARARPQVMAGGRHGVSMHAARARPSSPYFCRILTWLSKTAWGLHGGRHARCACACAAFFTVFLQDPHWAQ